MSRQASRTGSLLIISLWLITILSVLAVAVARYLSTEVRLARYRISHERAAALARGGVYVALRILMSDLETLEPGNQVYDWLGDDWAKPGSGSPDDGTWVAEWPVDGADLLSGLARVTVSIEDEERKFNVHSVPSPSDIGSWQFVALETLLTPSAAAVALVDWLDADMDPLDSAQPANEEDEPTGWRAKNAPAARLEELFAIPGLRDDVDSSEMRRLLSVSYGLTAKPNLNTISPELLASMGLPTLADALTDCRQRGIRFAEGIAFIQTADQCLGSAGTLPAEEQGRLQEFGSASQTFTVVSEGLIMEKDGSGVDRPPVRVTVEAVVRRTACEPMVAPCIIAWSS
jgi:type II secretory pathway component PulK